MATEPVGTEPEASDDGTTETGLDTQLVHRIAAALSGLRYGSVHIIVQDSHIVQIDRTEKLRFHVEG